MTIVHILYLIFVALTVAIIAYRWGYNRAMAKARPATEMLIGMAREIMAFNAARAEIHRITSQPRKE